MSLPSLSKMRLSVEDGVGNPFIPFPFVILVPAASISLATRQQPGLDLTPQKEEPAPDLMVFD